MRSVVLLRVCAGVLASAASVSGCQLLVGIDRLDLGAADSVTSDDGGTSTEAGSAPPTIPPTSDDAPAAIDGAITAAAGDTTAALTFTPPADGGSPITGYFYDLNGDDNWRSLAPSFVVAELTNGVTYIVRVRAINAKGASKTPSAPSNPVIPYGAPAAPTVTSTTANVTITWTWKANATNGQAIVGYAYKLDAANEVAVSTTTFSQAFAIGQTHKLCVVVVGDGETMRNRSAPACKAVALALPTAKGSTGGPAFDVAGTGGTTYPSEIASGQTYTINGACFRDPDIASNNGWWYRNAATQHWAPATNFVQQMNEFNATRVAGGNNCN